MRGPHRSTSASGGYSGSDGSGGSGFVAYKLINIGDTNQNMSQTVATPQKFLESFLLPGANCQHVWGQGTPALCACSPLADL